jgi:hypothetical protein
MQYVVIVGSGVVATFFGPFETKAEVEAWAKETENRQYVIVMIYPPYIGGRKA